MNSLLAPAIALMNRLSYGMKFCLISVLFFVPLGIVSTMLVQQSYERVEVTRHALDSLEVVQGVSKAMRSAEIAERGCHSDVGRTVLALLNHQGALQQLLLLFAVAQ